MKRELDLRGIDAWITREDEPSEPWGECDYCFRRFAERELVIMNMHGTFACKECARDVEPHDAPV
jgi:hypothetical protein